MDEKRLFNAMNMINEEYIEEAVGEKPVGKRNRHLYIRIPVIAAAVLFILCISVPNIVKRTGSKAPVFTGLTITAYAQTDDGVRAQDMAVDINVPFGKFFAVMNCTPGLPFDFNFDGGRLELQVDNGELLLWHDTKITKDSNGTVWFKPVKGEKHGVEQLGKSYTLDSSGTVLWSPLSNDPSLAKEATITYTIKNGDSTVKTGSIKITSSEDGSYSAQICE